MQLYDNAFSPFARKARLVLEHKGLDFEVLDGLLKTNHAALQAVNPRAEVPTLVDGDIVVVNSADIVSYLEYCYPQQPVYPQAAEARVHARAWERTADAYIDPILVDISYWQWAERPDTMPDGLLDAARADLERVYDALESELSQREFVSGVFSIADIALFPHIASVRALGVEYSAERHTSLARWYRQMRELPICINDLKRCRDYLANISGQGVERHKIFWRGDRIEWMLARGFHDWFFNEIRQQRVLWPGATLPTPLRATPTE